MKTHYFPTRLASLGLLFGMLGLLASCGASQSTASNDGIYGDGQQRSSRQTADSGNGYKQYFNSLQDDEIITDVEQYSSVNDSTQTDRGYANGNPSWEGSADNVTINVYDNNWGYNYWNNYWYSPYWSVGWGWNSWYGPGWGWNYGWGYGYPYYGYGWGGYPYYGYYGYGYPYHYGYAYNNGPRGVRGYVSPGRRDYAGRQYATASGRRNISYTTNGVRSSQYSGTRGTRTFTNNGTRTNNGVRTYSTTPRNNQNYNTPRTSQPTRSYSTPSSPTRSYSPSPSYGGGGRSSGGGSYGGGGGGGRSGGGGGGRR